MTRDICYIEAVWISNSRTLACTGYGYGLSSRKRCIRFGEKTQVSIFGREEKWLSTEKYNRIVQWDSQTEVRLKWIFCREII